MRHRAMQGELGGSSKRPRLHAMLIVPCRRHVLCAMPGSPSDFQSHLCFLFSATEATFQDPEGFNIDFDEASSLSDDIPLDMRMRLLDKSVFGPEV